MQPSSPVIVVMTSAAASAVTGSKTEQNNAQTVTPPVTPLENAGEGVAAQASEKKPVEKPEKLLSITPDIVKPVKVKAESARSSTAAEDEEMAAAEGAGAMADKSSLGTGCPIFLARIAVMNCNSLSGESLCLCFCEVLPL